MSEEDYTLTGDVADAVYAAVKVEWNPNELGELEERGDIPWTPGCAYTFDITTKSGQVFQVLVWEVPQHE